jgi:hypothetical protein
LLDEARTIKHRCRARDCADAVWYGSGGCTGLKARLCRLVGWEAERRGGDVALCSTAAYDLAYRVIYGALPDCRGCGC